MVHAWRIPVRWPTRNHLDTLPADGWASASLHSVDAEKTFTIATTLGFADKAGWLSATEWRSSSSLVQAAARINTHRDGWLMPREIEAWLPARGWHLPRGLQTGVTLLFFLWTHPLSADILLALF